MIVYISIPKRWDKTEVFFKRVPCKKRQKKIKVSSIERDV